jgi:type II secretory pathway pseudopilin PulG
MFKSIFIKIRKNGFTLMETLVYITILVIVIFSVSSVLIWSIQTNTKNKVMTETLSNARRAMEQITYEIREAKGVYGPTSVFDFNPGQLSLETEKYLPAGEDKSYIDFYILDGRLCFKKESQNPIFLTSDRVEVTNLVFSRIVTSQTPSIQINLTINYKNPNGRPEYQSSVSLRSVDSLRSY